MGKKSKAGIGVEIEATLKRAREQRANKEKELAGSPVRYPWTKYPTGYQLPPTPAKKVRRPMPSRSASLAELLYAAFVRNGICCCAEDRSTEDCEGCPSASEDSMPPWRELESCRQGGWGCAAWIFMFDESSPARELYEAAEAHLAWTQGEARKEDGDGRYDRFVKAVAEMKKRKDTE